MPFPEFVAMLLDAGVESYHVDDQSMSTTYHADPTRNSCGNPHHRAAVLEVNNE